MKKLLIVSNSFGIGGIQRSLENLLNIIDYEKYDVTLFLFNFNEKYRHKINPNVKLKESNRVLKLANTTGKEALKKGSLFLIVRKFIAVLCALFGANFMYKLMFTFEKKLGQYDVAISFSNNINNKSVYFGSNKFVLEKTKAKKKVAWLHVDYNKMNMNNDINRREYEFFDTIVHVTNAVKKTFLESYPHMAEKSVVVYNSVAESNVRELANKLEIKKTKSFTLVSVGRLDENKSPKTYVKVANELKKNDINFHWWIIGDGPEMSSVLDEIERHGLSHNISIHGELNNPYPYMKNADLFVSASKSESFGLAIAEALCLNTPVVARYYPALSELITDNMNGIISHGDDEELAKTVVNLIRNEERYKKLKKGTELKINSRIVSEQFDRLMK
jgi:glycosyltransferase involved in cell wall biosynthesis